MKIYRISGLGANDAAFKYLKFPEGFEVEYIPWIQPEKKESLQHYTERLAKPINQNEEFVLMGLSFGGIVVQEMNRFLNPKLNFLLSTIKSRSELPSFMRLSAFTNAHKLIPSSFLNSDSGISYLMVRKIYDARLPDINEFFEYRDPFYLKWSINEIVNWQNNVPMGKFVHYHGDQDLVFPFSKIENAVKIEGGTHLMVVQKAWKLNELIKKELLAL